MRTRWVAAAALTLTIAGCAAGGQDEALDARVSQDTRPTLSAATAAMSAGSLLAQHGLGDLAGKDAAELADRLGSLPADERPDGLQVVVRADSVELSDGDTVVTLPLDEAA